MNTSLSYLLDEDACLSTGETAQLLGVDRITLLRMRQLDDCGGLPWVRVSPGRIGYMRRDIRAYLAARRVGALPVLQEMAVA